MPCSPGRASGFSAARRRRPGRNLGLHTAPLGVDARCSDVVLVRRYRSGRTFLPAALGVGGCGEASLAELASLCADWGVGAWREVEALAFVVVWVSGEETGVVPDLDGAGGHVELCGDLGQGEHAGVE